MVAGWDHPLPEWFTRLHSQYRTPVKSIFFLGAITLAASAAVLIGVGGQESFEILRIWGFTFYGIAHMALFAIFTLARKETGIRPRWWLRFAAISGFLVTLLFVLLSAFPITEVASRSAYTIKTVCVIVGANVFAALFYFASRRGARAKS